MRVVGYALGAEGSTLYRTDAGDFFLYPTALGWLVVHESREQETLASQVLPNRREAIVWVAAR